MQNLFIFLKLIHQSAFRAIQLDFSSVKGQMFTSLEAKHLIDIRSYVLTAFSFLSLIRKKKSPDGDFSFIDKLFGTHPKLELRRHLYTHIEI